MRRLLSGFAVAAFLATIAACLPTMPSPAPAKKCPGALYCQSSVVPQTVSGGTCCVNGQNPNASIGYLCAFGANRQPAGCVNTVEWAREICGNNATIVRCVAE
jgi:hypothetical protein